MSAAAAPVGGARATTNALAGVLRGQGWTIGLIAIVIGLLLFTKGVQPRYGPIPIQGLATSVLPLVLAAVAQAIVVIAGGIDLSIGSMMALTSVVSATLMKGQSDEFGVAVVIGVLLLGLLLGFVNGGLVVVTRVPDIVVTLAMSFVWAGFALLVRSAPGGGAATWLKNVAVGPLGNEWVPKAAVVALVVIGVVWIPLVRSRLGLSIYAIGSNRLAAFRSGVPVGRTLVLAYMITGLFSALAGLSLTATTTIGSPVPGPYTLLSVAAVVLGGVSLAGGRGGVVGPIIAVVILQLIQTDLTFLHVDFELRPGGAGRDPHRGGHDRKRDPDASRSGVTAAVVEERRSGLDVVRALFRDQPIIPLTGLLAILVLTIELSNPGIVSLSWASVIMRAAVPLAILAGCQTLCMLTGGIDLSVGAVASMAGFVTATLIHTPGGVPQAILVALAAAALAGLVNGIAVGVFRVHPLIVTLGMSFIVLGLANVWQLENVQTGSGVPDILRTIGSATTFDIFPNSLVVFVPVLLFILLMLKRTGYGRLLFAIGDNPVAARLSGARSWKVLVVLYVISAVLAGIAGLVLSGLTNTASVSLAESSLLPSVAAAVIGGTSILGGRGGYGGTIVGALILTVLAALLTVLGLPEPTRQIVFGAIIVAVAAAYTRVTGET